MQFKHAMSVLLLALALPALAQHVHKEGAKRRPPPLAMGAAFAPSGELWIVGLDDRQRLFVQTSGDEGRGWAAPRVLDSGADKIAADGENRPKLAFGPHGAAVISYAQPLAQAVYRRGAPAALKPMSGTHFAAPLTVHHDRQVITHRFESIAFDAQGRLHTVWIDKRDAE